MIQRSDTLNKFRKSEPVENNQHNNTSKESNTFFNVDKANELLTNHMLTIGHLKIDILLRYGSYRRAGQEAGLSATRTKQILNGHFLPQTAKLIRQIANGWIIDPRK